jgi:hypothetical protein
MYKCLFNNMSVRQHVCLTICLFDNVSVWQYVCLTICLFDNMSVRQFVVCTTFDIMLFVNIAFGNLNFDKTSQYPVVLSVAKGQKTNFKLGNVVGRVAFVRTIRRKFVRKRISWAIKLFVVKWSLTEATTRCVGWNL